MKQMHYKGRGVRKAWGSMEEKFLESLTGLRRWGGEAGRRQRNHRSGEPEKYDALKTRRGTGVAKRLRGTPGEGPLVL